MRKRYIIDAKLYQKRSAQIQVKRVLRNKQKEMDSQLMKHLLERSTPFITMFIIAFYDKRVVSMEQFNCLKDRIRLNDKQFNSLEDRKRLYDSCELINNLRYTPMPMPTHSNCS